MFFFAVFVKSSRFRFCVNRGSFTAQTGATQNEHRTYRKLAKKFYLCNRILLLMNNIGKALLTAIIALFATWAGAQTKSLATKGTVYVFGVGDSMRDSTVYVTPVQKIEGANFQKHTKFLLDRPFFSQQLKAHFIKTLNDHNRLCIIYYSKSEKKANKKLQQVRRNYLDEGALLKQLPIEEFKFNPVSNAVHQESNEKIDEAFGVE